MFLTAFIILKQYLECGRIFLTVRLRTVYDTTCGILELCLLIIRDPSGNSSLDKERRPPNLRFESRKNKSVRRDAVQENILLRPAPVYLFIMHPPQNCSFREPPRPVHPVSIPLAYIKNMINLITNLY